MKRPLLLAHRGFSGNYPENSPLAFRMAVEKTAADGFESDVHITKDGKLVIFHDASVERTSNGTGFIKDMTYDELLSLDIGAWKSPGFAGQHIWTFGQLLDFCKETNVFTTAIHCILTMGADFVIYKFEMLPKFLNN